MAFAAPSTANLAPAQRARLGCDVRGLTNPTVRAQRRAAAGRVQASAIAAEEVPDMNKRVRAPARGSELRLLSLPLLQSHAVFHSLYSGNAYNSMLPATCR